MKLAEALALRADAQRKVAALSERIGSSARFQEGSEPAEDAAALIRQAEVELDALQVLIARINRTNLAATLPDGRSVTDALAERDVLRLRHRLLNDAAAAASGREEFGRQLRSELRTLTTLDVAELRRRADRVAATLREVDLAIQQVNWTVDLLD